MRMRERAEKLMFTWENERDFTLQVTAGGDSWRNPKDPEDTASGGQLGSLRV